MDKNNKEFKDVLNYYINLLNCTQKELSSASTIHSATIGKLRTGTIIPKKTSIQIERLINGIISLAKEKNISISKEQVTTDLYNSIEEEVDFDSIRRNLNELISTLNVKGSHLSRYIGYDNSFLSKIRSGNRKPSSINEFVDSVGDYIINNYKDNTSREKIIALIGKNNLDSNNINLELKRWLYSNNNFNKSDNEIKHFLNSLNKFNLEEYIKAIHFDNISFPKKMELPKTNTYYGIHEMKKGELDFFKGTLLSENKMPIFMCSDMEMSDMMKDFIFAKNWMTGIACILKKGLSINIIHNLDRPFNEMMAGLEAWIPLYMTGQIKPYYLKNYNDNTYSHLNYVSSSFALTGECIEGFHNKGKYYLTDNKKEVAYYQEKAKNLLKKATPLMDIYTNLKELSDFHSKDSKEDGNRIRILSNLPFHTISINLLDEIIKHNNISSKDEKLIKNYLKKE